MLPICQEKQQQLNRQYQQQTLPHAIIIQGVEGAGKGILAKWLIELLTCQNPSITINGLSNDVAISHACGECKTCLLKKSGSHPDHLLLTSENKTLGVDDIRRGNAFLEKTAHLGLVKTILIPKSQLMTVAAANALLKTLEEPSANSFIVLLTDDLESLLPTIVSRCAVYTIRPMVGEALLAQLKLSNNASYLSSTTTDGAINDNTFINVSQLAELSDETTSQKFEEFSCCYIEYLHTGHSESKLRSLLVENKHGFRWLEKITCNRVREYYLSSERQGRESAFIEPNNSGNKSIQANSELSVQVLNRIYQAIINSNKLIKSYTQANRQFVAEQLVMIINDIVRPSA